MVEKEDMVVFYDDLACCVQKRIKISADIVMD